MTLTKSLLTIFSAMTLGSGAAFAGGGSMSSHDASGPELLGGPSESMAQSSLETTDQAYAQSEPTMTDPFTLAESGQTIEAYDVYYIVPMEVVEVEEIWLIPSGDSQMPQG